MTFFPHLVAVSVAGDSVADSAQRLTTLLNGVVDEHFVPPAVVCSLGKHEGDRQEGGLLAPALLALLTLAEDGALLRFGQEHGWPRLVLPSDPAHGDPFWQWDGDGSAAPHYRSPREALLAARTAHAGQGAAPRTRVFSDGDLFRFAEEHGWPRPSTPIHPVPGPTFWHWGRNFVDAEQFPSPRAAIEAACAGLVSLETGQTVTPGETV